MNDILNLIAGEAGPTEWKIALLIWFGFTFVLLPLGAIKEWQKNPKNPDKGKIFGLLVWPILTAAVIIYLILTQGKSSPGYFKTQSKNVRTPTSSATSSPASKEEVIEEVQLQGADLEAYYAAYKNPFVLHIRKALDSYLSGTNEGIQEVAIKADITGDTISGLDSFSKDYYKSRFTVFAINDGTMGGKIVNIVFQDKPDKLFNVWVYQITDGSYDLRGFWQNKTFTEEEMQKIQKQYKIYLQDEENAL